ncbi:hypothetical protein FGADI_10236 [Fusarium gaditjirri]|uniref:Uncharacterized protein n=1 Tax=Fusarium gaditjirri TaxID=282569 RepID=A0A8H4SXY6_9HYPO|nr:hypothetical protein FGADI_10236 [Fusarium gaditjirri]
MKFSLIFAPLLLLLGDVVSAQSRLTDICTGSANNGCKTTITVPNGFKIVTSKKKVRSIQFNYIKVNVCDQIRKALGLTLGNKFLKARDPICNCFTKLRTLNSEGKFSSSSAGNFDVANSYYLDQAATLEKCLTDAGLKYSQTRDATLNKPKATGWKVALVADLQMGSKKRLTTLNLPLAAITTQYALAWTTAGLIGLISEARQIFSFNAKASGLLADVNKLRSNWAYIPPANEMVSRIQNNEIKVAKDVFKFMPVVNGMSTTSKKVATELAPLKSFATEYLADSKALHELITRMLAIDWEKVNQGEFDNTDQSGYYVRNGLISIQDSIKKELAEAVKVYFWLIRATDSQLKDFTLTNGRWKMEYGTVAYQRWSTIDIHMPCTKMTSKKEKKDGLTKTSNQYRTYWKCHFGPHTSQYQAVHVPYVKMYE